MNYKIITSIIAALISVGTIGAISSNANTDNSTNSNSVQTTQPAEPEQKEPKITTEEVTGTSEEPFETEYYDDSDLASGATRVDQEGQNGIRTKTYKVTYTDGKETSRELISDEITTEPVNKVVANGTYVAPTATAPEVPSASGESTTTEAPASAEAPAGATAICNDGTYSYSQNHSGTCSHHKGVKVWL